MALNDMTQILYNNIKILVPLQYNYDIANTWLLVDPPKCHIRVQPHHLIRRFS